jgi:riboflavin synthase
MFTGIIEGLGRVAKIEPVARSMRLTLTAPFDLRGTGIGDSMAVNGACLTLIQLAGNRFSVDVSPETLATTTLGGLRVGQQVNLERALRLSDRLDGHLVSGHVDGTGTLASKTSLGNVLVIVFQVNKALSRYMIQKGSVAVDGVSLTINRCYPTEFEVTVIPHTAKLTTIGSKRAGEAVNIETDVVGKYVERFVGVHQAGSSGVRQGGSGLDMNLLKKSGYL